jgi:signal transduction histidine kinase
MELMSQWSSMIVHDLKNYLTPLRMVARNLIEKQSRPDIAERCAHDLDLVADKMEKLVQTLRQLRENPGERMTLLSPNDLVREVTRDLQTENRPGLRVDLRLKATQTVRADEAMIRRVLENLVTNALEAMNGEGTVIIATNDCESREGRSVCVDVIDDGRGIPAEFLHSQLFRPFATTKKKGLGLGLYQCRSIIRAHGGELSAQSREGDGSTFRISLPVDESTVGVVKIDAPLVPAFSDGMTHG